MPFLRLWRQNTGVSYGVSLVKKVQRHLEEGNVGGAVKQMRSLQPTKYGLIGAADIGGILHGSGRSVGIECKLAGEKPTEDQVNWARMMVSFGALYILAYQVQDVYDCLTLEKVITWV